MVLPAHVLQAVQVTLKSVGNDGNFTPEVKIVFPSISHVGLQWGDRVI
jgi:hypothetical protein